MVVLSPPIKLCVLVYVFGCVCVYVYLHVGVCFESSTLQLIAMNCFAMKKNAIQPSVLQFSASSCPDHQTHRICVRICVVNH